MPMLVETPPTDEVRVFSMCMASSMGSAGLTTIGASIRRPSSRAVLDHEDSERVRSATVEADLVRCAPRRCFALNRSVR